MFRNTDSKKTNNIIYYLQHPVEQILINLENLKEIGLYGFGKAKFGFRK